MSAPVDVLAVLRQIADGEGDAELLAVRVHAAVAELIEADAEYDKCRSELRDFRLALWHNYPLHHETPHLLRYEASVKRRAAALCRVKGGAHEQ